MSSGKREQGIQRMPSGLERMTSFRIRWLGERCCPRSPARDRAGPALVRTSALIGLNELGLQKGLSLPVTQFYQIYV